MPAHRVIAFACLVALGCADDDLISRRSEELGQRPDPETEPNQTTANATAIGDDTVVRGTAFPVGDHDVYGFSALAGDRVYAATMTIGSSPNPNSVLEILRPDGTLIPNESDDDDGTFGASASTIAGTLIPSAGTYYVRARHSSATATDGTIRPYDLHFRLQRGAPAPEAEPNDAAPQALPASGWIAGETTAVTDVDLYSINLNAGDTVFVSLDMNPERDLVFWNGQVSIGPFNGTTIIANDGAAGSATNPNSEALFATVSNAGTYNIAVQTQTSALTFGTYHLSVSVHPGMPGSTGTCTTYNSTDTPLTIGPGLVQTVSTITVPGNPRIADVDVAIRGNHAAILDMDVRLQSPAGNDVGLFTDIGTSAATFVNFDMLIDEEAALPLQVTTPQVSTFNGANFQPEPDYRLHWLDGENGGGTWRLIINDDVANANGGTLAGWALTICEPTPPVCPGGAPPTTLFSLDFEAGAAGFTHIGTADEWALGTPTDPLVPTCNSGTQCWKTDLAGTYNVSSSQDLVSAPISLVGLSPPIRASWAMRYQMEIVHFDHANIRIREAGTGANERTLWEFLDNTMAGATAHTFGSTAVQQTAGWGVHTFDISAYAGRTVELVFHLDSDTSLNFAGLAIDDVSVSHCGVCGDGSVDAGGEQCDHGAANGTPGDCCSATCTFVSAATVCRASTSTCDAAEMCNGAGSCPADAVAPSSTVCRPAVAGGCDVAETCDGSTTVCPGDGVEPNGTVCRASSDVCDAAESCDGSAPNCPADTFANSGTCRVSAGVCDTAESCNGSGPSCPADTFASSGSCRPSAGLCDVVEACDGSGPNCPTDTFASSGTCRPSGGVCDLAEACDGSGANCPADVLATGTPCRPTAGLCDVAETCNGSGVNCPADAFASSGTCRGSAGICDVAETCSGSGPNCPTDGFAGTSTGCRASADVCDVAESCTGSSALCPTDVFAGTSTSCRASGGVCDVAESCTGTSAACPTDVFASTTTSCRVSAGLCDIAESCSGTSALCPTDVVRASGVSCRVSAGTCDIAEACDGSSPGCPTDVVRPSGTSCRMSTGACDAAEACDGSNGACPLDQSAADGTGCNDMNGCTQTDRCMSGACTGTNPITCPSPTECHIAGACNPTTGVCSNPNAPNGTACTDDGDICDGDEECMTGTCRSVAALDCEDGDECTVDTCDPTGGCMSVALVCDDSDPCTTNSCDSDTGCVFTDTCTDAGMPPDDAGMTDAGMSDAGSDASVPTEDAAVPVDDAGTDAAVGIDGGGMAEDGGAADGGTEPEDGGCSCRAAGTPGIPMAPLAPFALVALAIAVRIRRRRR